MHKKSFTSRLLGTASAVLAVAVTGLSAPALAQIEEIRVTAQKREEAVQSVPIAVTAFDASALERQQIDAFSDLQFATPNVTFTKGNFTGSNFQIRGIGSASVAASGDGGVGIHVNDVPLRAARLFETEYFDVENLSVLRGPQGTLFGRNSTGGAVNMITKKPDMDEFNGNIDIQFGNFDNRRVKGHVNMPLGENMALRLAGVVLDREGYTENLFTGNDIDGRSQFAVRGSLRMTPGDSTTIDLMVSYFDEDSNRGRINKQMCNWDPTGILGCLPDSLQFETTNSQATLGAILASDLVLGAGVGWGPFAPPLDPIRFNPMDLRKTNLDFEPVYTSDETLITFQIQHDWRDLTFTSLTGYQETSVFSQADYNLSVDGDPSLTHIGPGLDLIVAANPIVFNGASGCLPISAITSTNSGTSGGNVASCGSGARTSQGYDQSDGESEQFTQELRVQSDFDGRWNFLAGAFYMENEGRADYYVVATALDYFAALAGGGDAGAATVTIASPYFKSDTPVTTLDTWALFGEAYFDLTDNFKITAGLRYTNDEKTVQDRQFLANSFTEQQLIDLAADTTHGLGLDVDLDDDGIIDPAFLVIPSAFCPGVPGVDNCPALGDIMLNAKALGENGILNPWTGTPTGGSLNDFALLRTDNSSWEEITGRIGFDWTLDLDFTDATLLYAFYSRGYKGGGFNPPPQTIGLFPGTFDPEFVNAYEIGIKNNLWDNRFQANLTAFYYDYEGYQVTKIVDRTSVNENTDATIWGLEAEFVLAPNENWLFNAQVSYLNTELGNSSSVDTRDPTNGQAGLLLIKDLSDASNCVLDPGAMDIAFVTAVFGGLPAAFNPIPSGTTPIPGLASEGTWTTCDAVAGVIAGIDAGSFGPIAGWMAGEAAVTGGVEANLAGNQLPNSPELTFTVGGQYTHYFENDAALAFRVDYYWQDEMFASRFNNPVDLIDSWDIWNAAITFNSADERWYAKAYIQNIADSDNVTGHYLTDPSSGLFTNLFILDPRQFGVSVGFNF